MRAQDPTTTTILAWWRSNWVTAATGSLLSGVTVEVHLLTVCVTAVLQLYSYFRLGLSSKNEY